MTCKQWMNLNFDDFPTKKFNKLRKGGFFGVLDDDFLVSWMTVFLCVFDDSILSFWRRFRLYGVFCIRKIIFVSMVAFYTSNR